jgi:hypothetical protein
VLTFTASSTATTGTSTITITGTASGVPTATTTISLTVAAAAATKCQVNYVITQNSSSSFGAVITILNTGTTNWTSWTMTWTFANNQTITSSYGVNLTTSGESITMTPAGSYDAAIAAGATLSGDIGFQGTWNGTTNAVPAISINGTACTMN